MTWKHFDVECEAGLHCPLVDDDTKSAWWDTVPEVAADPYYNLAIAIEGHLAICEGPMTVKKVEP